MADAADSKSAGGQPPCEFDSRLGHFLIPPATFEQSFHRRGIAVIRHAAVSVVLTCFTLAPAHAQRAVAPPRDIDRYVQQIMADFEVPGLALAIVKDGQVVLAKGYGLRELGKPEKADENTLFGIASNTKAFTATALGLLVEEGKLEWDQKVITVLPWFRLSDPFVTS